MQKIVTEILPEPFPLVELDCGIPVNKAAFAECLVLC